MINIVHEIISYYKINALQELLIIVEFIILKQQFTIRCDYRLGSLNRTSLVGDYSWVHSFLWGCLQSLWDTRGWTRTGNPLRVGHGSCHAETCGILHRGWSRQVLACRVKHAGDLENTLTWRGGNLSWSYRKSTKWHNLHDCDLRNLLVRKGLDNVDIMHVWSGDPVSKTYWVCVLCCSRLEQAEREPEISLAQQVKHLQYRW